MSLISSAICQSLVLVIFLDKIGENSTRLPKNEIPIRILDDCLHISFYVIECKVTGKGTQHIPGTRPLGLRLVKGIDLIAVEGITFISYGIPNSSRRKMTCINLSAAPSDCSLQLYLPWIRTCNFLGTCEMIEPEYLGQGILSELTDHPHTNGLHYGDGGDGWCQRKEVSGGVRYYNKRGKATLQAESCLYRI